MKGEGMRMDMREEVADKKTGTEQSIRCEGIEPLVEAVPGETRSNPCLLSVAKAQCSPGGRL